MTFAAFVHLVHEHPRCQFAILDIDTGIGIFTPQRENAQHLLLLKNILTSASDQCTKMQYAFLQTIVASDKNNPRSIYNIFRFFRKHGSTLVNLLAQEKKVSPAQRIISA